MMNETIQSILTRRSIREFSGRKVSGEDLSLIIEAGLSAPSAHGKRSWHVAVFEDQNLRDRLAARLKYFRPVQQAAVGILVLGNPESGVQKDFWPQDCAALTENILIAARSLGLGTTWCGIFPVEQNIDSVRMELDIPNHLIPFGMIGVGYPVSTELFKERNREGDERRVSWNPNWIKG